MSSALTFARAEPVLLDDEGPSPLLSAVPDVLFVGITTGSGIGIGAGLGTLLVRRGCIESLLAFSSFLLDTPSEDEDEDGRGSLVDVADGLLELSGQVNGGVGSTFLGNVEALSMLAARPEFMGNFLGVEGRLGRKQGKGRLFETCRGRLSTATLSARIFNNPLNFRTGFLLQNPVPSRIACKRFGHRFAVCRGLPEVTST